jgi:ubiquinone/menaquinone biosynthesis C-methylase UbiE
VLDYDQEAGVYDATRGGEPRAEATAEAIGQLLPDSTRSLVDVACGTAIVTTRLRRPGRTVVGVDRSAGMLAVAAGRLPGALVQGDATRLPLGSATVDAVVLIWLLHLVPDPASVIAEAARILRPGGVLITTVDKNRANFTVHSDIAAVTEPWRAAYHATEADNADSVVAMTAGHGLRPVGEAGFTGIGQGRSPRHWQTIIRAGHIRWARGDDDVTELNRQLSLLPDQDGPRADPVYRLMVLSRR